MNQLFFIPMYAKFQIALQYFPHLINNPESATHALRRWINQCKGLNQALQKTGYKHRQQYFSERQVQIIHDFLGEP